MEICPFSGLPFTCALCPEDNAPCYEKIKLRTRDDKHPRSSFDLSHHLDPLTSEDFKVLNLYLKSHPFELPILCFDKEVFNA